LFGKLYKNKIPIQYGIPSPVYTGLFSKYKDTLKDFKNRCILILGASGTGKTFTVQQEAQKTYLVYIVANDFTLNEGIERDQSYKKFLSTISNDVYSLNQKKSIIKTYIFSRLLYLKLLLNENKNLSCTDFFLSQVNGNSKIISDIFKKIWKIFKNHNFYLSDQYDDLFDYLFDEINKFDVIKKYGIR
jgi:Cdc6-like AAA superfamily ATPase